MWHSKGANSMKKQSIFRPIPVLTKRMFRTNRGRNLVAILAILLTTMMFATLFTLTQSMSRNLVEMTFRQTGSDTQASIRGITEEQAAQIAAHPDVAGTGEIRCCGCDSGGDGDRARRGERNGSPGGQGGIRQARAETRRICNRVALLHRMRDSFE